MAGSQRRVAGYADLAKFIASDKVFCIFRRFEWLAVRTLLYMQDEICELEDRLRVLDQADLQSGDPTDLYSLHSRRDDTNVERREVMRQVREKLYRYRKFGQYNVSSGVSATVTNGRGRKIALYALSVHADGESERYVR
jgi:hypothetical protein